MANKHLFFQIGTSIKTLRGASALSDGVRAMLSPKFPPQHSLPFSSRPRLLACLATAALLYAWALSAWAAGPATKAIFRGHEGIVEALAYAPDGKTLASAGDDGTVKLWDTAAGKEIATLKGHLGEVLSVVFAPDGKTLASASEDGSVKVWNAAQRKETHTLKADVSAVYAVAYTPDGKLLASGGEDGTVRLWDPTSGQQKAALPRLTEGVWSLAFAPDGKTLAGGLGDETIRLWDTASLQLLATLRGHAGTIYTLAFAPDGKTLASGGEDETLRLWDIAQCRERAILAADQGWVLAVAYSPDGKFLASGGGDGSIILWDVSNEGQAAILQGHEGNIFALAFSPDGEMLASGSADSTARLWRVTAGKGVPKKGVPPSYCATEPVPRKDRTWGKRHQSFLERAKQGGVEVLFLGDSITQGWEESGTEAWKNSFEPLRAVAFGIDGDRTQHLLWRITTGGELAGLDPKVIVILIGTNNWGSNSPSDIAAGITAIVQELRRQKPHSKLLLLGLFPRRPEPANPVREKIREINRQIAVLDDGKAVLYMDLGQNFQNEKGEISSSVMPDYLHLSARGYQIWADGIRPRVLRLLGH